MPQSAVPAWMRSPLDVLSHAYAHYTGSTESDRRHALVGFDQAVEVAVHAYAEIVAQDPLAQSKDFRNRHKAKVDYLRQLLSLRGASFSGSLVGITYRHRLRNRIYHRPDWYVPARAEVEAARRDAVAVFDALAPIGAEARFPRSVAVAAIEPERLPDGPGARLTRDEARELEALAVDYAQRFDPDRDGVHYLELAGELEFGGRHPTPAQAHSLLNGAQVRFDGIGDGLFRWKDVEPDSSGLSGSALAEIAHRLAREADPDRRGLHYDRDIKHLVIGAGHRVGGRPPGKTMNSALRDATDRFVKLTPGRRDGMYVWLELPGDPGESPG